MVLFEDRLAKLAVAFLQARPNVFEMVGPDPMFEAVFPLKATRGDRLMILVDQHRLDARGAELDAKNALAALDGFLGIVLGVALGVVSIHVPLLRLGFLISWR